MGSQFSGLGLMNDRHHQSLFQSHGNADIHLVGDQNVISVKERVQKRVSTQYPGYRLDQKGRQGQFASYLFLQLPGQNLSLPFGFRHVDFDRGREVGSRLKTLLHALPDGPAQAGKCDAPARKSGGRRGRLPLDMALDIPQGGHATGSTALDFGKIQALFPGQTAGRRGGQSPGSLLGHRFSLGGRRFDRPVRSRSFRPGSSLTGRLARAGRSGSFRNLLQGFVGAGDDGDDGFHRHRFLRSHLDGSHNSRSRRFHIDGDLVGLHFQKRLSLGYRLTLLLVPLQNGTFFHGPA